MKIKIYEISNLGRDLANDFSDDDDEVTNTDNDVTKVIEIVEDVSTPKKPVRKPSLLVDTSHRHVGARKRSVTFEPVDVASLKLTSPETQTEENEEKEVQSGSEYYSGIQMVKVCLISKCSDFLI